MRSALAPDAGGPAVRFVKIVAAAFVGAWLSGIVVIIALQSSLCFISPVKRCFSIERDLTGVAFDIGPALAVPSFILAILVAAIACIRGVIIWWMVLVASLGVVFATAAINGGAIEEYPVYLATGLVLFLGVQLSRLTCRQF